MYEISLEPLNGFAPNSHGRRVWSLAWTTLNVKCQGHQGQVSSPLKMHCNALAADDVIQQHREPFRRCRWADGSDAQRGCVRFMFGETYLALVFLWPPYVIGQAIYIFILWFLLLFSLRNLSGRRLDIYHTQHYLMPWPRNFCAYKPHID